MKIYSSGFSPPVNNKKSPHIQAFHTVSMSCDSFSREPTPEKIAFKGITDKIKDFFSQDLDSLSPVEPVSDNIAAKLLHKNLEKAGFDYTKDDAKLDITELRKETDKKFTPEYIDIIAALMTLSKKANDLYIYDEIIDDANQFYDNKGNFQKEAFNILKKSLETVSLRTWQSTKRKLIHLAKEKDGTLNPKAMQLLKYNLSHYAFDYQDAIKPRGKVDEAAAGILDFLLEKTQNQDISESKIRHLLYALKDKNEKIDNEAIKFTKNLYLSDSNAQILADFVNAAKDNDGKFRPELAKYYKMFEIVSLKNYIKEYVVNDEGQFIPKLMEKMQTAVDFYTEYDTDIDKNQLDDFLKNIFTPGIFSGKNNFTFNEQIFNAYRYLAENYAGIIQSDYKFVKFNELIDVCLHNRSYFNKELFEFARPIIKKNPSMLEPDEEDDDFNVLKVSLRLMTNHDGTTDKNMLKLLKKRKNSPEFNDFVDFANIFSGKKNIVHILDDLWRVRKDFYEFLGKQGSNDEDYANSIFAVDDILKNAVISKENGTCIDYSYLEKVKELQPEYNLVAAGKIAKAFANDLDSPSYKAFKKLLKSAQENKITLRDGADELTDEDIKKFFSLNPLSVKTALDFLGEDRLKYAFKLKFDRFQSLIKNTANFITYNQNFAKNLKPVINPQDSEVYNSLQKQLAEQKAALAKQRTPEQIALEAKNQKLIQNLRAEISDLKLKLKTVPNSTEKAKITALIKEKNPQIKNLTSEIQNFYKNEEFKNLLEKISKTSKKINSILNNSLKDNEEIINHLFVLSTISSSMDQNEEDFYVKMLSQKDNASKAALKEFLYKKIFEPLDYEYNEDLLKRLNLASSKYLHCLFEEHDSEFTDCLTEIFDLLVENPDKSEKEIFNSLDQNIATKGQFESLGIDYDKWVSVDKNSYVPVLVKTDIEKAKQAAIKNLEEDLNDEILKKIPKAEIEKIFDSIREKGFEIRKNKEIVYDGDGFDNGFKETLRIYKNKKPLEFSGIAEVINAVKSVLEREEFWSKTTENEEIEQAKETFLTHILKMRENEYKNAENMKNNETAALEVHKTDMNNISHALFLGNHASCCTAVGSGCNEWSAPSYVMNKCISSIEVMDGKDFVGNTMCYIAKVDGEPALVLDNIEMNTKYQYNDKIRDAIFEYAQKLCKEIGKPELPIYAGPYRHKVNMEHFPFKEHNITIIGSSGGYDVYVDYLTDGVQITGKNTDENIKLYRIK